MKDAIIAMGKDDHLGGLGPRRGGEWLESQYWRNLSPYEQE